MAPSRQTSLLPVQTRTAISCRHFLTETVKKLETFAGRPASSTQYPPGMSLTKTDEGIHSAILNVKRMCAFMLKQKRTLHLPLETLTLRS